MWGTCMNKCLGHICARPHTYTYVCIYVCVHVCIHVCVYVCVCVCVCVWAHLDGEPALAEAQFNNGFEILAVWLCLRYHILP